MKVITVENKKKKKKGKGKERKKEEGETTSVFRVATIYEYPAI